jgi:hypothetical protein
LLYCSTCTILQQMWLLWSFYCSSCVIRKQIWLPLWYCSICTVPQHLGYSDSFIAVLAQYFNKCYYYGCCTVITHYFHGSGCCGCWNSSCDCSAWNTYHKIFRIPPHIRPMRGECKLTGILYLMYGHIILCDNLHYSSLRLFHIGITSLYSNAVCQELGFMWISSIY